MSITKASAHKTRNTRECTSCHKIIESGSYYLKITSQDLGKRAKIAILHPECYEFVPHDKIADALDKVGIPWAVKNEIMWVGKEMEKLRDDSEMEMEVEMDFLSQARANAGILEPEEDE